VQAAKDWTFGGVERLLSGPFPPTAAYVVSANAAPFSDLGLVLDGIRTLLPQHSPVLLLCARSSSHRLRLGIRPLERARWILGPETICRPFSVDCRTASRTAARAGGVRDPAGALGREGQSAAWLPGPASMADLRAGHLAEGARLRFRPPGGMGELSHGVAPDAGACRLWRQASLSSAYRYGPCASAYGGGAAGDQCGGGGPWASAAEAHTDPLRCRADSAVAKTSVHWPTDVRLLWDALRCLIRHRARLCQQHAIAGWRKARFWIKQVKRAFDRIRTARQWRNKEKAAIYLARSREIGGEGHGYTRAAAAKGR